MMVVREIESKRTVVKLLVPYEYPLFLKPKLHNCKVEQSELPHGIFDPLVDSRISHLRH